MLPLCGATGCDSMRGRPGPERSRDSPSNRKETSLLCSLSAGGDHLLNYCRPRESCCPVFGRLTFPVDHIKSRVLFPWLVFCRSLYHTTCKCIKWFTAFKSLILGVFLLIPLLDNYNVIFGAQAKKPVKPFSENLWKPAEDRSKIQRIIWLTPDWKSDACVDTKCIFLNHLSDACLLLIILIIKLC